MNMLLLSVLGRALKLYPVQIIALTVEPNHFHMMIRVINPEHASGFIGYFKAESAHHLNRLLGRQGRTVWSERFDSPIILDYEKALEVFSYITLNPVKDGLVNSIAEYPGVSSYPALRDGLNELTVKIIPKSAIEPLSNPARPFLEDDKLFRYYSSDEFKTETIRLEPECLRAAFSELENKCDAEVRELLLSRLRADELAFRESRGGKSAIGPTRLEKASMLTSHTPPKAGVKMLCLSTIAELRKNFIRQFRNLCQQCTEVFCRWKSGFTNIPFPPGMFAPSLPRNANMIPVILV
jgi:REP element-mobilizing transposase RayT